MTTNTTDARTPVSQDDRMIDAINHARGNHGLIIEELCDFLRIPSISTEPAHKDDCHQAAEWLRSKLDKAGLHNAEVLDTGGLPVVYAEWLTAGEKAPTVLIYGHYDVQPPDPIELWDTAPFEPTLKDNNLIARGAADDKGQLWIHVAALRSMLEVDKKLPINIKILFEGEEESGSEHLDNFVAKERDRLSCDVVMVSDSHMLSADKPSIVSSLRGMAYCEIEVQGPSQDLHSGTFGGAIRNPAEALAHMLAACKDAKSGRITIPGFYDDVHQPSDDERKALEEINFDDDEFRRDAGVTKTWGEDQWSIYEQIGIRPTFEINGIWSGYTGIGAKTVLPAVANAKVSMRLVANQDWKKISQLLETHLVSLAADMPGVEHIKVTPLHGGHPVMVDTNHPAMRAASKALANSFGREPVFTCEGGSIPVVATFAQELQAPAVLMGFGLPDDRLHSPNEKFSINQLKLGIEASIAFWHYYADINAEL